MKKLFLSIITITLALFVTACGSKSSSNSIIGTWENSDGGQVTITFKDTGTGFTTYNGEKYDDFKYTYEDEVLTLKYQTVMETELKYGCIIEDDSMTLKDGNTIIAVYKKTN